MRFSNLILVCLILFFNGIESLFIQKLTNKYLQTTKLGRLNQQKDASDALSLPDQEEAFRSEIVKNNILYESAPTFLNNRLTKVISGNIKRLHVKRNLKPHPPPNPINYPKLHHHNTENPSFLHLQILPDEPPSQPTHHPYNHPFDPSTYLDIIGDEALASDFKSESKDETENEFKSALKSRIKQMNTHERELPQVKFEGIGERVPSTFKKTGYFTIKVGIKSL